MAVKAPTFCGQWGSTKENKHFIHLDPDRVTYFGIYSKFWVCESLDGCVGDLGPGKIPEFVTLILLLLPAILSLVFRAASLGAFEIWYHSDALRWKIPVAGNNARLDRINAVSTACSGWLFPIAVSVAVVGVAAAVLIGVSRREILGCTNSASCRNEEPIVDEV
jgi:hypothetical protein